MNEARPRHRRWSVLVVTAGLCSSAPALAGKGDAIVRLVADGKIDAAQARCERWEAWDPDEEPDVRDACAQAFWPSAEARGDRATWAAFREQWSGTALAARARVEEGAATVRELPPEASEQVLLDLYEVYRGTPAADTLYKRASDAAVRDVRDATEARAVAERWPDHRELPSLVERFPEAFIQMTIEGRRVAWSVEPEVALTGDLAPTPAWVERSASGETRPWDEAVRGILLDWGLPGAAVGQLPVSQGLPALPVCWMPDQPSGWSAGVELRVGSGRVFEPVPWDEGCGPDHWPVFLSLEGDRVRGISLRPGHVIDLQAGSAPAGVAGIAAQLGPPQGNPVLWNGRIFQQVGGAWLVQPVSGGVPWATVTGPETGAVPLTANLRAGSIPDGWTVDSRKQPARVLSGALDRMPPALRTWTLAPGEARAVPPLVREILGLTPANATPTRSPAPALTPTGWARLPNGAVQRTPPSGASIAGLYQLTEAETATALLAVSSVGIDAGRIQLIDAWRSDLDGDGTTERILRCLIGGEGATVVVDPIREGDADPKKARVFFAPTPRVQADTRPADTPFTFRKGDFTYLAWSGQEVLGPTARRTFIEVVRSDGTGFVVDDLELP